VPAVGSGTGENCKSEASTKKSSFALPKNTSISSTPLRKTEVKPVSVCTSKKSEYPVVVGVSSAPAAKVIAAEVFERRIPNVGVPTTLSTST
jgi:hypothetical protein